MSASSGAWAAQTLLTPCACSTALSYDLSYTLVPQLNPGTGCESDSRSDTRTRTDQTSCLTDADTIKLHNVTDPTNVFATSETFEVKPAGSTYPPLITTLASSAASSATSSAAAGAASASNTAAAASSTSTQKTSGGQLGKHAKLALVAAEMVGVVWGLEHLVI